MATRKTATKRKTAPRKSTRSRAAKKARPAASAKAKPASTLKAASVEHTALLDAKKHLEKAIELHPEYAEAHFNLASLLAKLEDNAPARTHFEKALHLSENAQKEGLDRLQLDLFQKARTLYRLDRESEAHHLLKEWFESELETSQKGSLPAKMVAIETFIGRDEKGAKLRTAIGAEFDSFLAPRIIAVLKVILETLSNP